MLNSGQGLSPVILRITLLCKYGDFHFNDGEIEVLEE